MTTTPTVIIDNGEEHYELNETHYIWVDSMADAEQLRDLVLGAGQYRVLAFGEMVWLDSSHMIRVSDPDSSWLGPCFPCVGQLRALVRLAPTDFAKRVLAAREAGK